MPKEADLGTLGKALDAANGGENAERRPQRADSQNVKVTFLEEIAGPIKNVICTAYASRGKLARDVKSYMRVSFNAILSMPGRAGNVVRNPRIRAVLQEEEDLEALAAVVCGTGGALCLGSMGAVIGSFLGGSLGLLLGTMPALLTFGLSIPIGLLLGSISGLCIGISLGVTIGFVGGAAAGGIVAFYRFEIQRTWNRLIARIEYVYDRLITQPTLKVKLTSQKIYDKTRTSAIYTKESAAALVTNRRAQVTVAGGAMGATALGTAGAAGGVLAGGAAGFAVGLVPALFTFGLSIPICSIIGASMGLFVGTAAGNAVGFAGGATAGYAGYSVRHKPAEAIAYASERWQERGFVRTRSGSIGGTEDIGAEGDKSD